MQRDVMSLREAELRGQPLRRRQRVSERIRDLHSIVESRPALCRPAALVRSDT
eukprot:gene16555-20670_t